MNDRNLSVPHDRVTSEIIRRRDALLRSFGAANIALAEQEIFEQFGIHPGTQRRHKAELRKLLGIPARAALALLAAHPQINQAIEYVLVRGDRSDLNSLRSARSMHIVIPDTGEYLSIEEFLKSLYPREGVNATSCYRALKGRCLKKQIVVASQSEARPATLADLPSQASVVRFLRNWRKEYVAVRRGRSRKHNWESTQQVYVTRDVTEYSPGELWIGDHTELDFMILNEQGELDRRWVTAMIDIRTGLLVGYHLSWQPTSQTIALAYRNGVLGSQLKAFTGEKFEQVNIRNIPETVMMDNGKDYRSNYTQRIFGKIDFDDAARLSLQRMTTLHYVLPYHGQSKAQMERWFRTIQTMLKCLPGFKGNQYQNKPDSLKEEIKAGRILTVDRFDAMFALAVNTYNNRVRRTLKDQSPLQSYLTSYTRQRTIDERVLDFLMMKVCGRKIRRCQIILFNQEYYSDALMPFNDELAEVYYDPTDLGFVSIYVAGKFAAVAGNKEMIGRDERGWEKILRDRKRGERELQEELKDYRRGISSMDAKIMLLEGELLNMTPVSQEMLKRTTPTVTVLTGLEQQVKDQQAEIDKEKQVAEVEQRAKRRIKHSPLSLAVINERIK